MSDVEFRRVDLSAESKLKYAFRLGQLDDNDVLMITYSGRYRIGSAGNPDAVFMRALAQAAVEYWEPVGIVLDLSRLRYEWGDMLESVFSIGARHPIYLGANEALRESAPGRVCVEIPIEQATITGPACKAAIRTLLLGTNAPEDAPMTDFPWLCENLDAALAHLRGRLKAARHLRGALL